MKTTSILLFVTLLSYYRVCSQTRLSDQVNRLGSSLLSFFEETTHHTTLSQNYVLMVTNSSLVSLDIEMLVQKMSDSVRDQINTVTSVLKNTSDYASQLYTSYINSSSCCFTGYNTNGSVDDSYCDPSYYRAAVVGGTSPPLYYQPSFNRPVNLSSTSVHIPINVYQRDPNVLCFIEWSQNLTNKFIENWHLLSRVYQIRIGNQFIGSSTAACRFFPSSEFVLSGSCDSCPYERVDTFNAKNRPWYIETVYGGKAVAILIDTSGSMTGRRFKLAQLTARELILDLSVNDFFMTLTVGGDPDSAYNYYCFSDLVQATEANKLVIDDIISNSFGNPLGKADFGETMNFARDKLKNSTACHKIIVIFSDGDAIFPVDTFHFNDDNVKVFSFQVALKNSESSTMKELACNNRGIFRTIDDFDSVSSVTQAVTEDLNRYNPSFPVVSSQRYIDIWTEGLTVTFSTPVMTSVTNGDSDSRTFIGAMGIDVVSLGSTITTKGARLGPLGYVFLVDNNGHLVYHPLVSEVLLLSPHPGRLNIHDLTELEFSESLQTIQQLRRNMIDGLTGQINVSSYIDMEYQKRYIIRDMSYYYQSAMLSSVGLSLGLKFPSTGVSLLTYSSLTVTQLNELREYIILHEEHIYVSEQKSYCYDQYSYNLTNTSSVQSLLIRLIDIALNHQHSSSTECNSYLYEPLLTDLYFIFNNTIMDGQSTFINTTNNVISSFVMFSSGLLWCWGDDVTVNCPSLFHTNYIGLAENNGNILSVYRGTFWSNSTIVAVRPLIYPSSSITVNKVSIGVTGIILSQLTFEEEREEGNLYLIDEGGYLVSSSSSTHSLSNDTYFFGELYPNLFADLVTRKAFVKHKVTGYVTAPCTSNGSYIRTSSPASKITGFIITLFTMIGHILTTSSLFIFQTLFSPSLPSKDYDDKESNKTCLAIDLCQSQVTFYMVDYSTVASLTGHSLTTTDNVSYEVAIVTNTSLIAVFTNVSLEGVSGSHEDGGVVGPRQVRVPCHCELFNQPYRRPSSITTCPNQSDTSPAVECSSACTVHNTLSTATILLLILLQPFITTDLLLL